MKKFILSISVLVFLFTLNLSAQNTLIVDNTGNAPTGAHVYSTIQAAIDAADSGDVIQVMPSPTAYGVATFDGVSNVTLLGVGFNPQLISSEYNSTSTLSGIIIKGGSKGIRISGMICGSIEVGNSSDGSSVHAYNVIIEESFFNGLSITYSSNVVISKNLIMNGRQNDVYGSSNVVLHNNIFVGNGFRYMSSATFLNNLFLRSGDSNTLAQYIEFATFENNIIGGYTGLIAPQFSRLINSSFSYNYFEGEFPTSTTSTNNSFNNISSITGDMFEDERIIDGDWNSLWDPTPKATELINAGNDGTNLGPSGGSSPYRVISSPVPLIQELIAPQTLVVGQNFQVTIKAKGN